MNKTLDKFGSSFFLNKKTSALFFSFEKDKKDLENTIALGNPSIFFLNMILFFLFHLLKF